VFENSCVFLITYIRYDVTVEMDVSSSCSLACLVTKVTMNIFIKFFHLTSIIKFVKILLQSIGLGCISFCLKTLTYMYRLLGSCRYVKTQLSLYPIYYACDDMFRPLWAVFRSQKCIIRKTIQCMIISSGAHYERSTRSRCRLVYPY